MLTFTWHKATGVQRSLPRAHARYPLQGPLVFHLLPVLHQVNLGEFHVELQTSLFSGKRLWFYLSCSVFFFFFKFLKHSLR